MKIGDLIKVINAMNTAGKPSHINGDVGLIISTYPSVEDAKWGTCYRVAFGTVKRTLYAEEIEVCTCKMAQNVV